MLRAITLLTLTPSSFASAAHVCAEAIERKIECPAASAEAVRVLRGTRLGGLTVVQNVRTGALVASASTSDRAGISTRTLPLSLTKLLIGASYWDNGGRSRHADLPSPAEVHAMLINSLDAPGKEAAIALRHTLGTDRMLAAFKTYGLPSELSPATSDADWGAALSIGEIGFQTTALQIVSFLQAVGNDGIRIDVPPRAGTMRIMQEDTARELQTALLDTVERGTGRDIRGRLKSEWRIGGKTGTGPADHQPYDGWFAGLAFDDKGVPRYAFATLILGGGKGGGIAAEVSANVINFLVTGQPSVR